MKGPGTRQPAQGLGPPRRTKRDSRRGEEIAPGGPWAARRPAQNQRNSRGMRGTQENGPAHRAAHVATAALTPATRSGQPAPVTPQGETGHWHTERQPREGRWGEQEHHPPPPCRRQDPSGRYPGRSPHARQTAVRPAGRRDTTARGANWPRMAGHGLGPPTGSLAGPAPLSHCVI